MTDPTTDSASGETRRQRRFRHLPVRSFAPNILTVLALCAGLTAVRFALQERFELAIVAILVAAVLDGLDGRIARLLKGATKFGAELDSLSDFLSFGVAPVIVLYIWSLSSIGGIGWIVVLGFSICCALRLARFNVGHDDQDRATWASDYFVGVPAPAGALLAIVPLTLDFLGATWIEAVPFLIALYVAFVAFLMISRVPTFSFKRLRVRRDMVLPMLILVALFAAVVASYPWITLTILGISYLGTIPFSMASHRRLEARAAAGELLNGVEDDEAEDDGGVSSNER